MVGCITSFSLSYECNRQRYGLGTITVELTTAPPGDAPDSVRDQMMRHDPKFATFSGAYLNENARFDLQNAFLEEEKQDQLFRMFAHVSLTRDPRAVRDMVPEEVWINTPPDPEIVALEEERAALKQGRYRIEGHVAEKRIRELTNKISTKRATRDRTIVKEYREYYFYNRPTWDIEAQARDVEEEAYEVPTIDLTIPERARLADLLCFQPNNWTDEEATQYHIEATNLMVALCGRKEAGRAGRTQRRPQAVSFLNLGSPKLDAVSDICPEHDMFPLLMDATQCPVCIGDETLSLEERTFRWCRPTVRNDHFDDRHLGEWERAEQRGEAIKCEHPKCRREIFDHLDHFRSHVQSVHGVPLRSSEQVKQRRQRKVKQRLMARRNR